MLTHSNNLRYPILSRVVTMCMTIPVSSSHCEGLFSSAKRVTTGTRSMTNGTTKRMYLSLSGATYTEQTALLKARQTARINKVCGSVLVCYVAMYYVVWGLWALCGVAMRCVVFFGS